MYLFINYINLIKVFELIERFEGEFIISRNSNYADSGALRFPEDHKLRSTAR